MMIYYFSRTGRSREIANSIAQAKGIDAKEITDDENWKGAFNFLRGGYMSTTKKETNAHFEMPNKTQDIILVFPIWASGFPPAVRAFINGVGRDRITAVPTSLGSKLSDRDGFVAIYDLIGKEISTPQELLK